MDKDPAYLPFIPASTARAAHTFYGRGNIYLRLGDRLNDLVSKFDPRRISIQFGAGNGLVLAFLTIIQYVEEMTDLELSASIQHRMDLRYAVHLATPSPRLDPQVLCAFRARLLNNPDAFQLFREIFQTVYPEITTNADQEGLVIEETLHAICENEVRVSLMEAMLRSVEALSASHFDWLRRIALGHWYQRYNRSIVVSDSAQPFGRQNLPWEHIQADIHHLLSEINASRMQDIMDIPEIKDLSLTWEQLIHSDSLKDCDYCIKRHH